MATTKRRPMEPVRVTQEIELGVVTPDRHATDSMTVAAFRIIDEAVGRDGESGTFRFAFEGFAFEVNVTRD